MNHHAPPVSAAAHWRCNAKTCDWQPADPHTIYGEPAVQLAEHAASTGHPTCHLCRLSLAPTELITCERCILKARRELQRILDLYALLPVELGQLHGRAYDRTGGGGAETALPGGRVLTLLAGGNSGGVTSRRLTRTERAALSHPVRWWLHGRNGPLTKTAYQQLQRVAEGREHAVDQRPDDPSSVAQTLQGWADQWADLTGDPIPESSPVTTITTYLQRWIRWAATGQRPDGSYDDGTDTFPEFTDDIRKLRTELEAVHGLVNSPQRSEAHCLACGTRLVRRYRPADPCSHEPPAFIPAEVDILPLGLTYVVPMTLAERRKAHAVAVEHYDAAHRHCDQGGVREDQWTCPNCRTPHGPAEYLMARRSKLEATRREA